MRVYAVCTCAQLAIIESYLPAMMPEAEVAAAVAAVVAELGATSPKDMGRVMAAMKVGRHEGRGVCGACVWGAYHDGSPYVREALSAVARGAPFALLPCSAARAPGVMVTQCALHTLTCRPAPPGELTTSS